MRLSVKYRLAVTILIIFVPLIALSILYYFHLAEHNRQDIVSVPITDISQLAHISSSLYLKIILIVCPIVLILSAVLIRTITKKISSLSAGMKEIKRGNLDFRLKVSGNDELSVLAEVFNEMTTERKRVETELKDAKQFLSNVLDGIGEGLVVIDRDFRVLSANKHYCEQLKMSCESIIGRHCYEISHHFDEPCHEKHDGCECTVKQCFETGLHHRSLHTHYDKDNNPIYIETNAYPVKDESGNIFSAIETLIDVTDKVKLEKRMEELKEQYRKLYDDAPDMMHSLDRNGNIIICNKTESETLGYNFDELMCQPFTTIIYPDERDACKQKFESVKKEGFFEGELTLLAKDGRRIPVFVKTKAIYDDSGNFLMTDAVLRDITDKKMLETQLIHAQKMEAIGQLTGGIAHDFNNILTAIIGYGSLLQREIMEDNILNGHITQILSAAENAANLTQGLLAFSRRQLVDLRPVLLSDILKRVENILTRIIGENIDIKIFVSSHEATVMADAGQIEQIIMNLCTNAKDAMPDGGILMVDTELVEFDEDYVKTHALYTPGKYMLLSVADTGTGMDEETKEKLFEPFYTTKEVGKGTGLGLSIVYGIIRQHNGYINVYSEKERGTTFRIYLPAVEVQAEGLEASPALVLAPVTRGTETILLAEDEPALRRLSKNVLEESGYRVIEAVDGEDAIEKFKAHSDSVDLMVLDVIMPKKTGKDVYDEVRKQRPDIKVLFMSGYTANIIHKSGILKEGIELITKPFSPNKLLREVREVLDKSYKK